MTKIKLSGIGITAMSGAIGSEVITRNSYGYYRKTRLGAPAVTSPALAAWQAQFAAVEAIWDILTDNQRTLWIDAARSDYWRTDALARKQRHTGYTLFMYLNLNRILVGLATLTTPPAYAAPAVISQVSAVYSGPGTLIVNYTVSSDGWQTIYATKYLSPGRMSQNQIYAFIRTNFAAFPGPTGSNIYTLITAKYGAIQSGSKMFFRLDPISASGKRGVSDYCSVIFP